MQELLDDRGDRRRRFVLGQRRDDVAHVFREEVRVEAWFVGVLERPFAVHLEDAALGKAAEQRLANPRRVNAGFAGQRDHG